MFKQKLASDFLRDYIFLTVGKVGSSTDLIEQKVEFVNDFDKRDLLKDLLTSQRKNGTRGKVVMETYLDNGNIFCFLLFVKD